jgi:hypothetical protein
MDEAQKLEWLTCAESPAYFAHHYCQIYDATALAWVPFALWPAQIAAMRTFARVSLTIILKARQLGMSWLVLAFALWLMLFQPAATVLLFSRRDDEAVYLLDFRLKGMYLRLPAWMIATAKVAMSNDHTWSMTSGSTALAFPTSAGDSYTATLAIVDEADLVPDLGRLMRAVKPTIDGGGRMILLSRADKSAPNSEFKRTYRAAKAGDSPWSPIFLPWHVRPSRDAAWYDAQRRDVLGRTGALDDLHEQYPATDVEALSPRSLDKRIPAAWLDAVYHEAAATDAGPPLNGLTVYAMPVPGRKYVIGGDPAEGNPTSDDSSATVLDDTSGEEVAALIGKLQPAIFASQIATISDYFNAAPALIERNNHGHAVILWLKDNAPDVRLIDGHDGKTGWLSNSKGKALLYDELAEAVHDQDTRVHSFETYLQLASIEGASLRAPKGELDDRADSFALAQAGRRRRPQEESIVPAAVVTAAQLFGAPR